MIAVLTYDAPHRKSQDLLMRLRAHGYDDIEVYGFPWEQRKLHKPMISHRPGEPKWPAQPLPIHPREMCSNLAYRYACVAEDEMFGVLFKREPEMVLVGGAGILPRSMTEDLLILNAHPAMLPFCRGLDSLKWAIYKSLPVGVTLHVVDENTDAGFLLKQELVPLYPCDTFHAFAHRQYEMELALLVEGIEILRSMDAGWRASSRLSNDDEAYITGRRMKHVQEMVMLKRFEQRRDHND